ncbi:MAG: ergothioneine biosynthesis protein EgtB [Rhodocyclales bacterium]|nr:ergothioneine biosynthesis protein EgtB [Rhodocyclales bacterium]
MQSPLILSAQELCRLVREAREHTLKLVSDLHDEQFTVPLLEAVNPFRWELGHVAFFYDAFLLPALGERQFLLDGAEKLYDSFKVDHDDRWGLPLPSRQETLGYLSRVQERVLARLETAGSDPKVTYLTQLSVIHEDMHAEAFTYMRQTLGYVAPPLGEAPREIGGGPLPGDVDIPGGTFRLGAEPGPYFTFDNEKWAHAVEVAPFRIARAPVTNAEYACFVDDGGYRRPELWSHQGWLWRTRAGAQQPVYWARTGDGWLRRHYDRYVALEPHHPVVYVGWFEAEAFCAWAKRRLPSEAEWEMAASAASAEPGGRKRRYPWGDDPPSHERANLDGRLAGCVDVGAFPEGDSACGCRQMIGNVWEWTASAFFPFPGYVVDAPYREYSAPWFGYRKVLKGGAWATRSRFAWNTLRNFFPPYRRDIFAGFRTCAP